jgi:hypothetical protein
MYLYMQALLFIENLVVIQVIICLVFIGVSCLSTKNKKYDHNFGNSKCPNPKKNTKWNFNH